MVQHGEMVLYHDKFNHSESFVLAAKVKTNIGTSATRALLAYIICFGGTDVVASSSTP